MPTHYTLTPNAATPTTPRPCGEANQLSLTLWEDGKVRLGDTDIDLLTIYHTPDASGAYPSQFTLHLEYKTWRAVKPIHTFSSTSVVIDPSDDQMGRWTLAISGPNSNNDIGNFQLATTGSTPPEKLKIRVKRQPTFSCATGPFDDQL
jgi:hypothetical protein